MTNTELLKEKIKLSGYKRSFIAQQLGISTYCLAQKIDNKTEFKASEINALCGLLHIVSPEEKEAIFFAM